MVEWIVPPELSGVSLQALVAKHFPELSAKKIKKEIDAGLCRLNGHVVRFASTLVGRGDRVEFLGGKAPEESVVALSADRILYVDDVVAAYDKPPGVVSDDPRIITLLQKTLKHPTLLHRLDKNTSGVLLFATKGVASEEIERQFFAREVQKAYYAIVDGIPKDSSGTIEISMGKLSQYEGQAVWGEVASGVPSLTAWRVVKRGADAALVVCEPKTGRTHQIRVHMALLGHPILGDYHYGRTFVCGVRPPRIMLHAAQVVLKHPLTGKELLVRAEIPADFSTVLKKLGCTIGISS